MIPSVEPMRGEVWDAALPRAGKHPVVVLSVNVMTARLGSVAAVLVTGTSGPEATHIPLGADAGLTGHEESYANVTDIYTIPKSAFTRKRGLLHRAELTRLEEAITLYLGL